jgi:hypothetical protein
VLKRFVDNRSWLNWKDGGGRYLVKGDELIKYVTEQLLDYIDTPKEVRKRMKANRKDVRVNWQYRWFGMIPLALHMWFDSLRKKR